MTQMDLAVAAGVTLRTIQRIEHGTHAQQTRVAEAVASALDIPVGECFIAHDTHGSATNGRRVKPGSSPSSAKTRAAAKTEGA